MRNTDVNRRFSDWLLNPRETLDFEVKGWLDLSDEEHRALVAKALIALENHGGGHLLIGYAADGENRLMPDPGRPASMKLFDEDTVNDILKRYAEPRFHVDVSLQVHPETGQEFPLYTVHGTTTVPVRTASASPGNKVPQHAYFIRRAGPESNRPQTGAEWDALIRRCVQRQRQEIVAMLRDFSVPVVSPEEVRHTALRKKVEAALVRWKEQTDWLPSESVGLLSHGHYYLAASVEGKSKGLGLAGVRQANTLSRGPTHWGTFAEGYDARTMTKPHDGYIETSFANGEHVDASFAGFWRIHPDGFFFSLRGYAEDGFMQGSDRPGKLLNIEPNIWQVAEYLVRLASTADSMFEPGYRVLIEARWCGLKDRKLRGIGRRIFIPGGYAASQDEVTTSGEFSREALSDLLPDVVKELMQPLFESFDFCSPPLSLYQQEVKEMLERG